MITQEALLALRDAALAAVGLDHAQVAITFHDPRDGSMNEWFKNMRENNTHGVRFSPNKSSQTGEPFVTANITARNDTGFVSMTVYHYEQPTVIRRCVVCGAPPTLIVMKTSQDVYVCDTHEAGMSHAPDGALSPVRTIDY